MAQRTMLAAGQPRRRMARPGRHPSASRTAARTAAVTQARLDLDAGPERIDWRLDEPTRQAGRRGIAAARAALLAVTRSPAA